MAEKKHGAEQKATAGAEQAGPAEQAPVLTEAEKRQVRILTMVVIGLGVLLVAGLAALVATVVMRASGRPAQTAAVEMNLPVPRGAVVEEMTLDGSVLAMRLLHPSGREIIVLDARKGRVLRRVRLVEQGRGD